MKKPKQAPLEIQLTYDRHCEPDIVRLKTFKQGEKGEELHSSYKFTIPEWIVFVGSISRFDTNLGAELKKLEDKKHPSE